MPQNYAVLDNGTGASSRPGRGKKKQREFVAKYLASKGVEKNPAGSRSKREMRLRAEGRAMFQQRKAARMAKKSGSSSKTPSTTPKTTTPKTTTTTKKVVTATRPKETAEMRSGGLGNTKAERSRGMSAVEARYLDVGPKKRAIVVSPKVKRNFGRSKDARQRFLKSEKKGY